MERYFETNFVEITNNINTHKSLPCIYYKDIDKEFISRLIQDDKVKTIQISKELPPEAYEIVDHILEIKPDLNFRIYNPNYDDLLALSFLQEMPHLKHLVIDSNSPNNIDFDILTKLQIKSLHLNIFGLKDYYFIQYLSTDIEELVVNADGKSRSIHFDCRWLLRYSKLHTLWLGKNANKNIECLSEMKSLKALTLKGINLKIAQLTHD